MAKRHNMLRYASYTLNDTVALWQMSQRFYNNLLHTEQNIGSLNFVRIHHKSFYFQSWSVNRLNLPGIFQPTDTLPHNPHRSCTETNTVQFCQHSDPRFKACTRVKIWMTFCSSGYKMRVKKHLASPLNYSPCLTVIYQIIKSQRVLFLLTAEMAVSIIFVRFVFHRHGNPSFLSPFTHLLYRS